MFDDPIVAEIRKFREEYAASFGYDLGKIVSDLRSRQGKDGRRIVDRTSQKKIDQGEALTPPVTRVLDGTATSATE